MLVRAVLVVLGMLLVAASLNDVFQSVIVPRAVGRRFRPSYYQTRAMWMLWPRLARKVHPSNDDAREDFLAVFAPFNLVFTLVIWATLLLLGYGLIFYGLRDQVRPAIGSFGDAVYFAGTSFFTIGFGDFVGNTGLTRILSVVAGASGFGVVSTATAFLFALFGSFQTREQFVVTVGARAGSPPSGVGLLTIASRAGVAKDLSVVMRSAETWCASLMETHLAYPALAYFRSSHDYESWVGTLGTILDAAVLMMTTVQCDAGEARILYNLGRHATHDLSKSFRLYGDAAHPGITREQFYEAYQRLSDAGLALHDRDSAWDRFATLRSSYAGHLNRLAEYFDIPPILWVGERPLITSEHMRGQLDPEILAKIEGGQKP
jgi:Ion channel